MLRGLALLLWLALAGLPQAFAQPLQPVPPLAARVTDLTGTLDATQKQQLEGQLQALEQRKGSQVVVLMVPTVQPEAIEQYSIRVAEAWKIGRGQVDGKRVDDGVIVLVAKNDRKVRIEVGYGLEGAIPDALAKRIVSEAISPRFRQGDFYGGLRIAIDDVAKLIDGEQLPAPWQAGNRAPPDPSADDLGWVGTALFVLVGGLIATAVLGRFLGSMAGGVGAGFAAKALIGLPLLLAVPIGLGAFLFLLVFSAAGFGGGRRVGRSGPVIMLPPGGFGGGGGFGRGGGGGFSGGGGGFGGGGASGDW